MSKCEICKYGKKNKKINYARLIGYGIAIGITLYAAYEQYFDNSNEDNVKIEQIGKSIDNCFE
jgi:seryl-tRNA synthetase